MTVQRWRRVSVRVPNNAVDAVSNFLVELGSSGIAEEACSPDTPQPATKLVQGFFSEDVDPADLYDRLSIYLGDVTAEYPALRYTEPEIDVISSETWQKHWKAHFRPLRIGHRLFILPPWKTTCKSQDRLPIVINPGQAFGTGHHATTQACLEAVDGLCIDGGPPARALDLGTGSGVLAIALAKLGTREVWATDIDPDALQEARRNTVRNRVTNVRISAASLTDLPTPFELVVANIFAAVLMAVRSDLTKAVCRGGHAVLSGIESGQAPAVLNAFCHSAWTLKRQQTQDGWVTLILRRN